MSEQQNQQCIRHGEKIVRLETQMTQMEGVIKDVSTLLKEYDGRMDGIERDAKEAKGKNSIITGLLWSIISLLTALGGTFIAYALGAFGGK